MIAAAWDTTQIPARNQMREDVVVDGFWRTGETRVEKGVAQQRQDKEKKYRFLLYCYLC